MKRYFILCMACVMSAIVSANTQWVVISDCSWDLDDATNTASLNGIATSEAITSLTIPNTIEYNNHTYQVTKITGISYLPGVQSLAIRQLFIPTSVVDIEIGITQNCKYLEEIVVAEGNPVYDSREKCNAVIKTATNTIVAGCNASTFPESVVAIGEIAFPQRTADVFIPKHIIRIDPRAFYFSTMKSIVVAPENPIYDSRNNCNAIIVTAANCLLQGSTSCVIPSTVTSIADAAFCGLTDLKEINLPESVVSLGVESFANTNPDAIHCGATVPPVCKTYTFRDVNKSTLLYVPGESIEAYREAEGWKEFLSITTGIVANSSADTHTAKRLEHGMITLKNGQNTFVVDGKLQR